MVFDTIRQDFFFDNIFLQYISTRFFDIIFLQDFSTLYFDGNRQISTVNARVHHIKCLKILSKQDSTTFFDIPVRQEYSTVFFDTVFRQQMTIRHRSVRFFDNILTAFDIVTAFFDKFFRQNTIRQVFSTSFFDKI